MQISKLKVKILQGKEFVLDLIFPKFCVGCAKEGAWVCEDCQDKILPVVTQVCPECGRISKSGKYCLRHQKPHGLGGIIVSCYYEEGPIKEMVHNLKYNNVTELAEILGNLMAKSLADNLIVNDKLMTAVPLHFWRRAQRGYNQSELLAETIAGKLQIEKNFKILAKNKRTPTQVSKSGSARRKNLLNSFKVLSKTVIKGRTIILVDDVTTTGTTLNECAKVLRAAGARKVWGLVVAKG